jgi:hypothetical protein
MQHHATRSLSEMLEDGDTSISLQSLDLLPSSDGYPDLSSPVLPSPMAPLDGNYFSPARTSFGSGSITSASTGFTGQNSAAYTQLYRRYQQSQSRLQQVFHENERLKLV